MKFGKLFKFILRNIGIEVDHKKKQGHTIHAYSWNWKTKKLYKAYELHNLFHLSTDNYMWIDFLVTLKEESHEIGSALLISFW